MGTKKTEKKVVEGVVRYENPCDGHLATKSEMVDTEMWSNLGNIEVPSQISNPELKCNVIAKDSKGCYFTIKEYVDALMMDPYRRDPKFRINL